MAIEVSCSGSPPEHTPVVPLLSRAEFVKNFEIDTENRGATKRKRGGKPAQHDWDDFWVEMCRYIHENGIPSTQAELVDRMLDWFIDRGDESIDPRTIEKKVAKLFRILSSD